jgi:copper oxidase (laccase) domain-containing protein
VRVSENRERLAQRYGAPPAARWLNQVHGTVVDADRDHRFRPKRTHRSQSPGRACAILTADCVPLLVW